MRDMTTKSGADCKPLMIFPGDYHRGAGGGSIGRRYRLIRSCAGFTLMEVMVAVSIIAIVLVSVFRMHAQSISMNQSVQFYTTAPQLAQAKMSELERTVTDSGAEQSGSFGDRFDGYVWKASIQEVESEPLGSIAGDLKRIDLSVSYRDDQLVYLLRNYVMARDEQ